MPNDALWTRIRRWLGPADADAASAERDEAARLRQLVLAAPVAIVTFQRDGGIASWNRAAERLFGWTGAEVIGQPPLFLAEEDRAAQQALDRRILAGNEIFHRRTALRTKAGERIDLLASSAPQRGPDGAIIGIVAVYEEMQAQAAVALPTEEAPESPSLPPAAPEPPMRPEPAPHTERPSQFLARVSHDLRQPLHTLSLLTGALDRRVKDPAARELVADAAAMVRSLQESFDNVIDLARLEEGRVAANMTEFAAADVLGPLATEYARLAQDRGIAFRYVPCSAVLHADPLLLQRLLRQVLGNALRFTGEGRPGKILLGLRRRAEGPRIVVLDRGIGLAEDQAEAVFAPFFQLDAGRAAGGLGLGLAIARKLAELQGAAIHLRARPERGTQVAIDLPGVG